MPRLLQWLWFALAVFVIFGLFLWTRYEPVSVSVGSSLGSIVVWDRWNNRACVVGANTEQKVVCTYTEIEESIYYQRLQ
jgi:hypothetical protein